MIRLSHHLVKRRASRSPVGSPMPSAAKRKTTGWSWPRRRIDFARPVLAARPGRPPRFAGRPPCFSPLRRAGVHARRTLAISKIGASRRRGVRRDEGIPPYVSPDSRGRPGWPKTQNLFVGAGFTAPAGAFRRPTAAQRRLLGRRSRPQPPAPPQTGRIWRPPLRGLHFPGWPPRPHMGHSGHFKTDTATRPQACLAGPGARFCSVFCFNAPGIRPRGRRGCAGLSRGCRSCARRCAAAARRAARR